MIFIIEGADGSGKTTLINAMRAYKNRHMHFLASNKPPASIEAIRNEVNWIEQTPPTMTLVCDRYRLISERVYGKILRDRDLSESFPIDSYLRGKVLIHCRPPYHVIQASIRNNVQLSGVRGHIADIVRSYDELFRELSVSGHNVQLYDWTEHNTDVLISSFMG